MKKYFLVSFAMMAVAGLASAHAVVHPSQVGVGSFQTFDLGIPVEKAMPTTAIKLVIPDGLQYVSPNVKPGWKINVVKSGTGMDAVVTEINWTGGSIPAGQRDDFIFSAKVPSQAGTLPWKAYQTYSDGSVVSWDKTPPADTPYSQTAIVNDLAAPIDHTAQKANWALGLSIATLLLGAACIYILHRKHDHH
jgi:uncharacterized protein YcnI